ncbi:phosphoenolpyruvate hydrolase family protein [Propylenella binzhouense]|uniref:Phosphoenolpyruvate hydrolase family protein n=1 Tax=Propylenella binzhouense TaxID=2555902 RepID=A0A964T4P0_9HYPH|nr:phosphoenolpyruvate hydrolase family protein [Propylenella binzhouense]MYZ48451.1 phosphoenolpyruvate hydrolase family protein [Propylenella binzhouense]
MAQRIAREEIFRRLAGVRSRGEPILGAGASAGIIAKCAEIGGADLLIIYSTGKSRLMGLPTSRIGDSNAITQAMLDEISNVTKTIPLIAGVEATDPTRLDLSRLLDRFIEHDISGVINFPTILMMPGYADKREMVGLGFSREVEMIRVARSKDLFTLAYVFDAEQAKRVADAGCDCICAHVGVTKGGLVSVKDDRPLRELAASVQGIIEGARSVAPDILCLAHGGGFSAPEDTRALYELTDAEGFVGASSIERIPIERAVVDVVKAFKAVPLHMRGQQGAAQ